MPAARHAHRTIHPIDRVSPEDAMQLAASAGPVPFQVGAVLRLAESVDLASARRVVAQRVVAVPRLRRRLVRTPPGCGRPIWVDDPGFDVREHVDTRPCAPPGDESALLATATAVATERLPRDRPLWRMSLVTGLDDGAALVVVFDHVLADGIGGLAVLASLVDGTPLPADGDFPRPAPTRADLFADTWRHRAQSPRRLRHVVVGARDAVHELMPSTTVHAPATTLNVPTGAARCLRVARADLRTLHALARDHGATVNDVLLTAMAGALGSLLERRGEPVDHVVASVPVSARSTATAADLGNRVGVMPVQLPVGGTPGARLDEIAATTRAHKTARRGMSAAVLGPVFRVLAATGTFGWFVNHQRMVNVFETNLRGPDREVSFAGRRVTEVLPITTISGNVGISFAVMSYAGGLAVVIVADPEHQPDVDVLRALLQQELDAL